MGRPQSALSKFILSLPHNLSVPDVIAQARAKGMKTDDSNVYRVRRLFKAKAGKAAAKSKPTTTTSSKALQSKVGFIRSLPASMPVAQVVAKAKAQGLKIAESYVHWARWQSKNMGKKVRKATATATKPRSTAVKKPQSKAGFIRSFPTSMAAKEFVAKAKAAGRDIHVNQVYKVRGPAKATTHTKVTKLAARRASTPRNGASVARPITTISSAEDLLRALGAEIGLGRAVEILTDERAKLRAAIGV